MTTKEMIAWYADYRGYTLTTAHKDKIQRRIKAYLYMDVSQGILTHNLVRETRALRGIEEFKKLTEESICEKS